MLARGWKEGGGQVGGGTSGGAAHRERRLVENQANAVLLIELGT